MMRQPQRTDICEHGDRSKANKFSDEIGWLMGKHYPNLSGQSCVFLSRLDNIARIGFGNIWPQAVSTALALPALVAWHGKMN
jgi:hypothetical protein